MKIDYVVTVSDHRRQTCPFFPGGKGIIHKGLEDPAASSGREGQKMALFGRVRDEIRGWIDETFGGETVS
jgi:arsenate reductase